MIKQTVLLAATSLLIATSGFADWSRSGTTLIYVNGIGPLLPDPNKPNEINVSTQTKLIENQLASHLAPKGRSAQMPRVDYSYNETEGFYQDLLQSAEQAVNVTDLRPYLRDLNTLTDPAAGPYPLFGAGAVFSAYTEQVVLRRLSHTATVRPVDYQNLLDKIRREIHAHQQVILFGHSQGNFYTNYAYQELLMDSAFQSSEGITLPNPNILSVVGVANPASFSADGRYAYVTDCNDIILLVPLHLRANIGSCELIDLLTTGSLTAADFGRFAREYRALASPLDSWHTLLTDPLFFGWSVLDAGNAFKYAARLAYSALVRHPLDSGYLSEGSKQQSRIMDLLMDSLSDPACGTDTNCYLNEHFGLGDYSNNWSVTTGLGDSVSEPSGIMEILSPQYSSGSEATTVRSRRRLVGPFAADVSVRSLGPGTTSVSLRRLSDDQPVLSYSLGSRNFPSWAPASNVYFYSNQTSLNDWQTIHFRNNDSIITLSLGATVLTSVSSDFSTGYYLTLESAGDPIALFRNRAQFRDVYVTRYTTPESYESGRLKVTGSVTISPTGAKFSSQSITGEFTVQNTSGQPLALDKLVLGGRLDGKNPCTGPCPDFSPTITGMTLQPGKSYTYRGTLQLGQGGHYDFFVAYLPTGGDWMVNLPTAAGQVNSIAIDALTPAVPTVSGIGLISGGPVAGSPFDAILGGARFEQAPGTLQVWACQLPGDTPCYRQPAQLVNVSGGQATLTSLNLGGGVWHVRARNTLYGAWSNFSNTFTVGPKAVTPLSVTCAPSSNTVIEGALVTFRATPIGTSPFKFVWTGAVSGTAQNISKAFSLAGSYTAQVSVSDASGTSAQTATCTVQVNAVAAPPSAPGLSSVDISATPVAGTNFNASLAGSGFGAGTMQVWFFGQTTCLSGCRQPDAGVRVDGTGVATISNIQLGVDSYRVKVRNGDAGAWSAPSSPFQTIAASAPNFSLGTPNGNASAVAGNGTSYALVVSSRNGFTGTVNWQVTGLPTGAVISNQQQLVSVTGSSAAVTITIGTSAAVVPGTYPLLLRASSGLLYQSLNLTLNISAPPVSGSCSVNGSSIPISVNSGVALNYAISPLGGRSPYHYGWIGIDGTGDVSTVTVTPSGLASIDVSSRITDSSTPQATATVACPRVTINPPLSVTCAPIQTPITLGRQVDFEASVSGGTKPYLYSWSGLFTGTAANALGIPGTTGTFNETLVITDSGVPSQSRTAACSVTVNPAPDVSVQGVSTSVIIQQGQTGGPLQVAVTPTGGLTGVVTMTISGQPFGVTINPASTTITGPGTVYLSSNVVAASNATLGDFPLTAIVGPGVGNKSIPMSVRINPPQLGVTCSISPNPMSLGSGGTLSASAFGGYGGYQYNLNGAGYATNTTIGLFGGTVGTLTGTVFVRDVQGNVANTTCSANVQGVAPSVSTFVPDNQPHNLQNFSATINGTGFVSTATVWFYGPGCSSGCQQPGAGVIVQGLNSIRVVNVRLGTGTNQVEVRTPYGSARSGNFSVIP